MVTLIKNLSHDELEWESHSIGPVSETDCNKKSIYRALLLVFPGLSFNPTLSVDLCPHPLFGLSSSFCVHCISPWKKSHPSCWWSGLALGQLSITASTLHMLFQTDLIDVCSCYLVIIFLRRLFRRSHGGFYWSLPPPLSLSLSLSHNLWVSHAVSSSSATTSATSATLFSVNKTKFFNQTFFAIK